MLPFKIALRFLTTGRFQTVLMLTGISVAVSIQLFVGLLIDSLQKNLVERTVENSPQITIVSTTETSTIRDWRIFMDTIERLGLTRNIAASASANAFIKDDDKDYPVLLRGFDFRSADQIYSIGNAIYEGAAYKTPRDVIIGRELRDELHMNIGDKLTVMTPAGLETLFTIAGFYDLGVASINSSWVITNANTVQQIFGFGNRMTSIEMTVNDVFMADTIADRIRQTINNGSVKVENWKEQNAQLLSGLQSQLASSLIIQVVIILSMITGIASVLIISVLQKSRQIGILKAMGIKDSDASMRFIYQGLILGVVGSIIGIILGIGLLLAFNTFNVDAGGVPLLELYIDYKFILVSWLIVVAASIFASLIPSRKSLSLNPVDVIREG